MARLLDGSRNVDNQTIKKESYNTFVRLLILETG